MLASSVVSWNPKIIISSDEVRAIETASYVKAKNPATEMRMDIRLKERNWGDWNGKDWSFISDKLSHLNIEERYNFIPPNGESWKMFENRLISLIKEIEKEDKNIILITHKGVLRALTARLVFNNPASHEVINQKTGSLLVLKGSGDLDFQLEHFSNPLF